MTVSNTASFLRLARESLELTRDFVERHARLQPGTLENIETGRAAADTADLDALAELYGLPPAALVTGELDAEDLEPVRVLLKASDPNLSGIVRSNIARVAAAMRDLRALEDELAEPDRYERLRNTFRHEGTYGAAGEEWREGRELAERFRDTENIQGPVQSVRDLVARLDIELIGVDLGDPEVAGFSLSDSVHGPTIVINQQGANANPWVRRFTVAHELCHVLHDERVHRDVAPVQLYGPSELDDGGDTSVGPEPRANAFAAHLLAPDNDVRASVPAPAGSESDLASSVRTLMRRFGINFKTARWRMVHAWQMPKGDLENLRHIPTAPTGKWIQDWRSREAIFEHEYFPARSVPHERRGRLTRLAIRCWQAGALDRRQALELLRAAPDEDLEAIADVVATS